MKSRKRIICDNLFTLFNFLNFAIAGLLFAVGAYKNMLFLGVIILNIIIGTAQELKARKLVEELSLQPSLGQTLCRRAGARGGSGRSEAGRRHDPAKRRPDLCRCRNRFRYAEGQRIPFDRGERCHRKGYGKRGAFGQLRYLWKGLCPGSSRRRRQLYCKAFFGGQEDQAGGIGASGFHEKGH